MRLWSAAGSNVEAILPILVEDNRPLLLLGHECRLVDDLVDVVLSELHLMRRLHDDVELGPHLAVHLIKQVFK